MYAVWSAKKRLCHATLLQFDNHELVASGDSRLYYDLQHGPDRGIFVKNIIDYCFLDPKLLLLFLKNLINSVAFY